MTVYRHISEAKKAKGLSVSLQCELLGVSESGYWAWAPPGAVGSGAVMTRG